MSVRSQDVLVFATAVEVFLNTARGLFNVNSLFIFLAFDARALKNCIANTVVLKQNALGSTSPPRLAILNSFWCSSNRLSVTSEEVLYEINNFLQDVQSCIFFGCQFSGQCSRSHSNILQHLPGKCPAKSHWKELPPANCSPLSYQHDLRVHYTVHFVPLLLTRRLAAADLSSGSFF